MTIEEAFKALKEGKAIRLPNSSMQNWCVIKDDVLVHLNNESRRYWDFEYLDYEEVMSNNWEIREIKNEKFK